MFEKSRLDDVLYMLHGSHLVPTGDWYHEGKLMPIVCSYLATIYIQYDEYSDDMEVLMEKLHKVYSKGSVDRTNDACFYKFKKYVEHGYDYNHDMSKCNAILN